MRLMRVTGNNMPYAGMSDAQERANLVAICSRCADMAIQLPPLPYEPANWEFAARNLRHARGVSIT